VHRLGFNSIPGASNDAGLRMPGVDFHDATHLRPLLEDETIREVRTD
jgi:hypothetical protein